MSDYVTKSIPASRPGVTFISKPRGAFKPYVFNEVCTVSLVCILPGGRPGLQSHTGRPALWVVIDDCAIVQAGDIKDY